MGCGEFLVKYILFFTNLVFALAGLGLLGLGIAAQLQISAVTNVVEGQIELAPISCMVFGGIIFCISFFGCCGAIRESNCMLVTYAITMIILMVIKVALAIMVFVNLDKLIAQIPQLINEAFKDQNSFHELEKALHCCGTNGTSSYLPNAIPDSCCAAPPCLPLVNAYSGCIDVVKGFFGTFGTAIGAVLIVVAAVELVAVVFGLCLANHVRNKSRRSRY